MYAWLVQYVNSGLSAIPCRKVTKRPLVPWQPYQTHLPTPQELRAWSRLPLDAVALVGGSVSGGLEILDFDAPPLFAPWVEAVRSTAPLLLGDLPTVRTQHGGYHVYFRSSQPEGNRKLAVDHQRHTLIETRGAGGYALTHPTPGYTLLQGSLTAIPTISSADRTLLLDTARAFTEAPEGLPTPRPQPRNQVRPSVRGEKLRPGDDFNARGDPRPVLEDAGWHCARVNGAAEYWRRPGKQSSWSATLNALAGLPHYLYVFSSNAWPFESERVYSPFAIFALLQHAGDFRQAASALRRLGYGA